MYKDIQNNKLFILGKLSASLAHELRNPLTALKLNLNYLNIDSVSFKDDQKECINACLESADRIQNLIENTLNFLKKSDNDFEYFNLIGVIKKSIEIMTGFGLKKAVKIIFRSTNDSELLYGDPNKILQVFVNLISNSIDASYPDSEINISVQKFNSKIQCVVKDDGSGMDLKTRENSFNDFFTTKEDGNGIGLSVCKKILKEHNASISFESELNKGTSFFLNFIICDKVNNETETTHN